VEVELTIKDLFSFDVMRMTNGVLTPYLFRMDWEIVEAAETAASITTDNSISFLNAAILPSMSRDLRWLERKYCSP
jgi:hypothetical protein